MAGSFSLVIVTFRILIIFMTKEFSIIKNTSFLIVGSIVQRFLSFFTTILITRHLGPSQYGQFTFVVAFVTVIAVFWDFGLNTLYVRDVSRDKNIAAEYAGSTIVLKTILFFLTLPVLIYYLVFFEYNRNVFLGVLIFTTGSFVFSLNGLFESIYSAWKRLDYSAVLNILRAVFLLLFIIIVVKKTGGIVEITIYYFISFVVVFIISAVILKKNFVTPIFTHLSLLTLWEMIIKAFPFLITSVISIILFKIDHLMLSKMSGDTQLGLYGAAYTILEIIIAFFPVLIMRSAYPVLCDRYHNDPSGMVELFLKLLKVLLLFGLPISAGIYLLGDDIIIALFGHEYASAGILMSVLGLAIWVFFTTGR